MRLPRDRTRHTTVDGAGTVYAQQRRSEARDIWFAIAILLVLSAYRLVSGLALYVEDFFRAYTELPISEYLILLWSPYP